MSPSGTGRPVTNPASAHRFNDDPDRSGAYATAVAFKLRLETGR